MKASPGSAYGHWLQRTAERPKQLWYLPASNEVPSRTLAPAKGAHMAIPVKAQ